MTTDHELVLYVMTGCPYCIKVKRFLADNGVTIPERNISTDSDAEQTLIAVGGKHVHQHPKSTFFDIFGCWCTVFAGSHRGRS